TLLIVSTIFAVLQFGRQAAMMPSSIAHVSTTVSGTVSRRLTNGSPELQRLSAMLHETMTVNATSRPRCPRSNPFSFTDSQRPVVSHFFQTKILLNSTVNFQLTASTRRVSKGRGK